MSYFLSPDELTIGKETMIPDPEASHIVRTRRHKVGDTIEMQDEKPERFLVEIVGERGGEIVVRPLRAIPMPLPPSRIVRLIQILPAFDTADMIVQKATELGVETVVLVQGERTPIRLDRDARAKKISRWNTIVWEACKQSGRPTPPIVFYKDTIEEALDALPKETQLFTADMGGNRFATKIPHSRIPIGIIIGPEGGFSSTEHNLLNQRSTSISLGVYTLRAETAAIAAMSIALTE